MQSDSSVLTLAWSRTATSQAAPTPRWGHSVTYFPASRSCLLYGGYGEDKVYLSDFYALEEDTEAIAEGRRSFIWEPILSASLPPTQSNSAIPIPRHPGNVVVPQSRDVSHSSPSQQPSTPPTLPHSTSPASSPSPLYLLPPMNAFLGIVNSETPKRHSLVGRGKWPGPRSNHSMVLIGHLVVVFGGGNGSKSHSSARPPTPPKAPPAASASVPSSAAQINQAAPGLWEMIDFPAAEPDLMSPSEYASKKALPPDNSSEVKSTDPNVLVAESGRGDELASFEDLVIFDLQSSQWVTPVVSGVPPVSRSYHSCVVDRNTAVVFGGHNPQLGELNDLHILKHLGDYRFEWSTPSVKGDPPRARRFHSAVVLEHRMIVFGGCHTGYLPLGDMFSLDLHTFHWSEIPQENRPTARWGHSAVGLQGSFMVLFGGRSNVDHDDVWVLTKWYQWLKISCTRLSPSPRRRHSAVCTDRGEMIVFGGYDGGFYNDCWTLSLAPLLALSVDQQQRLGWEQRQAYRQHTAVPTASSLQSTLLVPLQSRSPIVASDVVSFALTHQVKKDLKRLMTSLKRLESYRDLAKRPDVDLASVVLKDKNNPRSWGILIGERRKVLQLTREHSDSAVAAVPPAKAVGSEEKSSLEHSDSMLSAASSISTDTAPEPVRAKRRSSSKDLSRKDIERRSAEESRDSERSKRERRKEKSRHSITEERKVPEFPLGPPSPSSPALVAAPSSSAPTPSSIAPRERSSSLWMPPRSPSIPIEPKKEPVEKDKRSSSFSAITAYFQRFRNGASSSTSPPPAGQSLSNNPSPSKLPLTIEQREKAIVANAISLGFAKPAILKCMEEMKAEGLPADDLNGLLDRLTVSAIEEPIEEDDDDSEEVVNISYGFEDDQYQAKISARTIRQKEKELKALRERLEALEETMLCKVCLEAHIDVVLTPCGHRCVCSKCSSRMQSRGTNFCVVCRKPWKTVIKTFDS